MFENNYKPISFKQKDGKHICIRKVEKGNIYKKCMTPLSYCSWCYKNICPMKECIPQYIIRSCGYTSPCKLHEKCLECDSITCCPSGICKKCEVIHQYDMITDNVAIGSYQSSYEPFDLVINLDYPANFGEIVCTDKNNKRIIRCGYEDVPEGGGLTSDKLEDLLNRIDEYKMNKNNTKILFHCYSGVSRSATVAIAYLAKSENKTTKEVYELAKQKRRRINPNNGFKKMIDLD